MIYLECNPDKALVQTLGIPKKEIVHAGDKGEVCNRLKNSRNSKGMVDEDPSSPQPRYIEKLKMNSHEYDIKLLYEEKSQNHLIVLCPTLEDWILKAAKDARVNVDDYSLPDDAYELHKIINIKLEKFVQLIEDIKKQSKMLKTLEKLIRSK